MGYNPTGYYPSGYFAPGYFPDEEDIVVAPSTCTGGLISLDLVRTYLEYPDSDVSDDTELCRMIKEASASFISDCHQPIAQAEKVDPWTGHGMNIHVIDYSPVANLTLEEEVSFNTWDVIDSESYYIDGTTIYMDGAFMRGRRYRATFDVGYSTIPSDIQGLILNHVLLNYKDHKIGDGEDRLGKKSKAESAGTGDKSITITFDREEFQKRWDAKVAVYGRFA